MDDGLDGAHDFRWLVVRPFIVFTLLLDNALLRRSDTFLSTTPGFSKPFVHRTSVPQLRED